GAQHRIVPLDADGHEAGARLPRVRLAERKSRELRIPDAPEEGIRLQARAPAGDAQRVRTVLGEQHADVHLVRLRLEPVEEAPDAVPLRLPLAGPVVAALDHPAPVRLVELAPRAIERDTRDPRVALEVGLAFLEARGLPGLDRAAAQAHRFVGNDQAEVDPDDATEAPAGFAGAQRRVEREQAGKRVGVCDVAMRAVQPGAERPALRHLAVLVDDEGLDAATSLPEPGLDRLG